MAQISPATQTVIIAGGYNASQNNGQPMIISGNNRWKNKPQTNAATAGAIIFTSAGMNMSFAVGWSKYNFSQAGLMHFCYSWFIGVIIGTILAVPLQKFVSKKYIMGASTLLVLVGGIVFASVPYNYNALLAARYVNGIAVGLATVTYLLYASEIACDNYRGTIVALEHYAVACGIALEMIYASVWSSYDFPMNRLHGIFDIIFGALAAVMLIYFIESPMDQIRMGDEAEALNSMARLQNPGGVTVETTARLEQCKMYVREHESMSFTTSIRHGILPLVKMLFFRSVIVAFSYSLPLSMALQYTMLINGVTWTAIVAGLCRMLGTLFTLCLVDKLDRKLPSLIWIACIGGLMIGLGSIFRNLTALANTSSMSTASTLYIVLQVFAGLFSPYTSVLLAEAFPLRVKGFMMGICIIVEQILQIILIVTSTPYIGGSLMAQGVIVVVVFLLMLLSIPETRGTSLSEAQRRFRNLFYVKLN